MVGEMIISGSSSLPPGGPIDFRVLNAKWDFSIGAILGPPNPTQNIPTAQGADLFNGPFGEVAMVDQGGFGQGYFDTLPSNAIVLAESQDNQPVIILDCTTLDLILADGDVHNSLSGVSEGADLLNAQDTFWANTIAFMDQLEDPPFIENMSSMLSFGEEYNTYQWNKDGNAIPDATTETFEPSENGNYSVTVELDEGCVLTSPNVAFMLSNVKEIKALTNLTIFPNPASAFVQLNLELEHSVMLAIELIDLLGRPVQAIAQRQQFASSPSKTHPTNRY